MIIKIPIETEPGSVCLWDIIKNWLMQLWKLTSPKICRIRHHARDQESQQSNFSLSSKAWKPGQLDCVVSVWRLACSKPGRDNVSVQVWKQEKLLSKFKASQAERVSSYSAFLFYSVYWSKYEISSKHLHKNIQNNVSPNTWVTNWHIKLTIIHDFN